MGNVLDCLKRKKKNKKEGLVDIIMGPAYYNILKVPKCEIFDPFFFTSINPI